jgi:hypothetical protein
VRVVTSKLLRVCFPTPEAILEAIPSSMACGEGKFYSEQHQEHRVMSKKRGSESGDTSRAKSGVGNAAVPSESSQQEAKGKI